MVIKNEQNVKKTKETWSVSYTAGSLAKGVINNKSNL
jgi:hypothetical protein